MKKTILTSIVLLATIALAQEFNTPESAAFDPISKRYFISNFGDGNIIQIDQKGNKSIFQTSLSKSLGMIIKDNILYGITNLKMVKGYNLNNSKEVFQITINEAIFLNDITCDNNGFIYVTDSNAGAIYKIDLSKKSYEPLIKTELKGPNGIIFDKHNNRLVFCYFNTDSQIDAINLIDNKWSTLKKVDFGNLDGIAMDESGNFYISSWHTGSFQEGFSQEGKIYKFDNQFKNEPEIFINNLHSPADITYAKEKKELIIPLFLDNKVEFKSIK